MTKLIVTTRDARALELVEAKPKGCTPINYPGPQKGGGMSELPIIVYESAVPLSEGERFMAFLTAKANGNADSSRSCLLPVRFVASTAMGARERALAFWKDEIAKAAAKRQRGIELGNRRRKSPLPISAS